MSRTTPNKSIELWTRNLPASVKKGFPLATKLVGAAITSLAMMPQSAVADPGDAGPLFFQAYWDDDLPGVFVIDGWSGDHTFGTGPQIMDSVFSDPPYNYTTTVSISSNLSQRQGWQYDFNVDFTGANLNPTAYVDFNKITFILTHIEPPGTATPISAVQVKNALGDVVPFLNIANTGVRIYIQVDMAAITLDANTPDLMTVQWNEIPAPGVMALLCMAGVIGVPRRRRELPSRLQ